MYSDEPTLEKGQKIPILKAIIVQYIIIAVKSQLVKCFFKKLEFFYGRTKCFLCTKNKYGSPEYKTAISVVLFFIIGPCYYKEQLGKVVEICKYNIASAELFVNSGIRSLGSA